MEAEVPCVEFVYQRLVQLVARAFYAIDLNALLNEEAAEAAVPAAGNKRKRQPADFSGLGVVVMDALMHRPWWEEEEFARKLGLPVRPVRQVLRLLETHCLVSREHRKERKRKADGGPEAPVEADVVEESQQERHNLISYCSLDYARMFDATRLRLHRMRRRLKDELEDRRAVAEYTCPACARSYTTLQAPFLIKGDGLFHCEDCDAVLESAADGPSGGLSRRQRAAAVKRKQAALEEQLRPLTQLLADIERRVAGGEEVPDFGTLASWAAAEAARSGAAPRAGRAGGSGAGRQQAAAQISVDIQGPEALPSDGGPAAAPRELPPWLQRQQAAAAAGASGSYSLSQELTDAKDVKDVKSASPVDEKKAEEAEYMRQYAARMEAAAAAAAAPAPAGGSAAGGWQEVPEAGSGGWAEVGPDPAAPVKQEPGAAAAAAEPAGNGAGGGGAAEADEDEWEDA